MPKTVYSAAPAVSLRQAVGPETENHLGCPNQHMQQQNRAINFLPALAKTIVLTTLLLWLQAGVANDLTAEPLFGSSNTFSLTRSAPKFLPVEDAYQLAAVQPGEESDSLLLQWQLAPGYYLYQHQFRVLDENGIAPGNPPSVSFDHAGQIQYDEFYERELTVFYDQVTMTLSGDRGFLNAFLVESQACADAGLCYPPRKQLVRRNSTGKYIVSEHSPSTSPTPLSETPQTGVNLITALLFAVIGGLILNLMPCVFPVLSIKILSMAAHHPSTGQRLSHGAAYSLGVILSFLIVAALMLALRSAGNAIGWGFQLQSPYVVVALTYLFVLMGLSFSGFFYLGSRLMNVGQGAAEGQTLRASFFTGVLATVVASPCSAPFMGTALGFALTQTPASSLLVFAALGLGMALPFLLLSLSPYWLEKLPKPGAWMETLKQFLAFPLYLSAAWLLWVLGRQSGSDAVAAALVGIVLLVFAIWITHQPGRTSVRRRGVAIAAIVASLWIPVHSLNLASHNIQTAWEPYSPKRLESLRLQRRTVFINLTADWCITCLANERAVLAQESTEALFRSTNTAYLKGDWTRYDPDITDLLNRHGRSGVPLYLVYSPGAEQAEILPQILTFNRLRESLQPQSNDASKITEKENPQNIAQRADK
ncbi:MAG: protein-disulfide reductase DsbD family protein [bacterium]